MRPTAKAMIELLARANRKRGGLFVMKGAQAEKVNATFSELYVAPDDIDNVDSGE